MIKGSGLLVAALVVWLGAGPLVVDQCLVGCDHDAPAASSSAPSCHETGHGSGGARWQATRVCNHDHSRPSAEAAVKLAPQSPLKIVPAAQPSDYDTILEESSIAIGPSTAPPPGGATAAAFLRPLRL